MKLCHFKPTDQVDGLGRRKFTCRRCSYLSVFIPDRGQPIYRYCDRQAGLGDRVAWLLSLVGITQPRVEAIVGDCGCAERQAKLNQVGWELSDRWRNAWRSLSGWWNRSL